FPPFRKVPQPGKRFDHGIKCPQGNRSERPDHALVVALRAFVLAFDFTLIGADVVGSCRPADLAAMLIRVRRAERQLLVRAFLPIAIVAFPVVVQRAGSANAFEALSRGCHAASTWPAEP